MAKLEVFFDEACVHLDSYVSAQNQLLWGSDNPHAYVETSLHP